MRKKIAAGNWKMNLDHSQALELTRSICDYEIPDDVNVILGVPFVYLQEVIRESESNARVSVAAQNCHHKESGAFTGEVSAEMLSSLEVPYVIIGHSERRELFGETDDVIREKLDLLLQHNRKVIFCCGEPLEIRESNTQNGYVSQQLVNSIFHLEKEQFDSLVIAYEPIWAIGTGLTATPEQAQDMHSFIRTLVSEKYGETTASSLSILYGGSVKPANAADLFSQADVDGGLVGGASLDAGSFRNIISSF